MALVSKLEDENRRLRDDLERSSQYDKSDLPSPTEIISKLKIREFLLVFLKFLDVRHEELQCIKSLTEENLKLKRLLKSKEKECTQKTLDLETVRKENDFVELVFSLFV